MTIIKKYTMTCDECGFSTKDQALMEGHSCEVTENGGHCEDYPCCGHEAGDCNGLKFGSDQSIKEWVEQNWANGHGYCEHEAGIFNCEGYDEEAVDEEYGKDVDFLEKLEASVQDQEPEDESYTKSMEDEDEEVTKVTVYVDDRPFIEYNDYGY